jgi:hypothetical protein
MPDFGTLPINIPYLVPTSGTTQDYINYLDSGVYQNLNIGTHRDANYPYSAYTENYSGFTYYAVGGSRIQELKKYGANPYDGVELEFDTDDNGDYTGYTFTYPITGKTTPSTETLYYRDYSDGYTMITGRTDGFRTEIDLINYTLSRNEHFLGFVEEPTIYSDVFVERGKQGVMEMNLRLGEIENMGELSVYGNGFFKVKKQ